MAERGPGRGVAPCENDRQTRGVLALLARPGAVARVVPAKRYGGAAQVSIQPHGSGRRCARIDLAVMHALAARDLVATDGPDRWRITAAGLAWIDRDCTPHDRFRSQHQPIEQRLVETPDGVHRSMRVNGAESPLAWLRGRPDHEGGSYLSQEQFEAGERMRRDYTAAMMAPSVTANWSGFHLPRQARRRVSADVLSDSAVAARQRIEAALEAVGPEFAGLLVDVCCLLTGLEDVERARKWPKRSAKLVLRLGLAQLARHYGLGPRECSSGRRRRHHWARPGYRPVIDAGVPEAE
jgi:hypothetical protein